MGHHDGRAQAGGLAYTFLGLNNSGVNLPSDDTIMTAHPEDAHGAPLYPYLHFGA